MSAEQDAIDKISTIINESLMGYAPGTVEQVRQGTWNAVDDEIDTDAIARELYTRLVMETDEDVLNDDEAAELDEHLVLMDEQRDAAGPQDDPPW